MKNKAVKRKNIKLDLLLLCCRYCSLASKANFPKPIIKLINEPNKAPISIPITLTKKTFPCGNLATVIYNNGGKTDE